MKIMPGLEQIRPFAGAYRVYPLCAEILSDMRTPLEVLRTLQNVSGHVYLLESVSGHENWGRYTFLGYDPKLEITCKDGIMNIGALEIETNDPGRYIRQVLSEHKSPGPQLMRPLAGNGGAFPPFTGGLIYKNTT